MVIPFVNGVLGTVTKGLVKPLEDLEIRGGVEINQLPHWQDRAEYREESWRLEETCCHTDSCESSSSFADVKNSREVKMIIDQMNMHSQESILENETDKILCDSEI